MFWILYYAAAVLLLLKMFDIGKTLLYYFGRSGENMLKRYGVGSYAVVTGCTEGIGRAFAYALAKRGFNLVLISRSELKLEEVSKNIRSKHDVKIRTLARDFTTSEDVAYFEEIAKQVADVDVSLLVNNVGVDAIERFDEQPPQAIKRLLMTNVNPLTFLTRFLLHKLADRKRSAVITVSSTAAYFGMHHMGAYAGTKAYGQLFTAALRREYRNVDMLSLHPGKVSTAMNDYMEKNVFTTTADECVEGCLDDLLRGYATSEGHVKHKVLATLMRHLQNIFHLIWENVELPKMRKERKLPPPKI